MKININLDPSKYSKISKTKLYDLGPVVTTINDLLDSAEITIVDNSIPVLVIGDNKYLMPDLQIDYSKLFKRSIANVTEDDLISLGGSSSGSTLQEVTDNGNSTINPIIIGTTTGFSYKNATISKDFLNILNKVGPTDEYINISSSEIKYKSALESERTFTLPDNKSGQIALLSDASGANNIKLQITQTGTSNPVVNIVNSNNIFVASALRVSLGIYSITFSGLSNNPDNYSVQFTDNRPSADLIFSKCYRFSTNTFYFRTYDEATVGTGVDGQLNCYFTLEDHV